MPQMAPISWLILFFIFSFSFIIFNVLNYFCFYNKTNKSIMTSNNENKSQYLNWKW